MPRRNFIDGLFARETHTEPTKVAQAVSMREQLRDDLRAWDSVCKDTTADVVRVRTMPGGQKALDRAFDLGWARAHAMRSVELGSRTDPNRIVIFDHSDFRAKALRLPDMLPAYEGEPVESRKIMLSPNGPRDVQDYVEACTAFNRLTATNREFVAVFGTPEGVWLTEDPVSQRLPVRGLLPSVNGAHIIGAQLYEKSHRR